eukprot:CAMPEP_0172508962 /NCGR_PEP_ID=MMETSP1066-20121228/216474_1 /TAXON_ID=671091 /ORGANISM="Coscinodiscus wailesii, Strain CCMP2513" /LENGTH=31 /DNA_ID= /DNA_START= /DNA_END= /DNA_ORIENTATION=
MASCVQEKDGKVRVAFEEVPGRVSKILSASK